MKIPFTKLLIAALLFLFCAVQVSAQDSTGDLDTVVVTASDSAPPQSLGDTTLNKYEFDTEDSMQVYKKDKDFAYMKYLDSLLRNTKGLSIDTFSIGSSSEGPVRVRQRTASVRMNIFNQPEVKIILWVLAVLLIGFLIWKLFLSENFFRRDRRYKGSTIEKEEDELSDASAYDRLIAQAVAAKNYRLAIRYLYLQTLKKLTDSGLLQFSADKTNYQYVKELQGKPYQNDFAAITLNYDYVWYGKFEIDEDVYTKLSGNFRSFHKKV
jgi:hypothetical protein